MTEQEGKVMKSKMSLLTKYEIPLDHLSFEYVKKCNDRKELERIVKILRSGEEGYYPQLTESAESRLKQVAPQSRLLWTEDSVLTKSTLGIENWNKVADEMADWAQEMKSRDQVLEDSCSPDLELPAVRQMKGKEFSSTQADKHKAGPSRAKSAAPRDYSEWDKFDVDKEILKMELEDERKREQIVKNKKQQESEKKKTNNEEDNSVLKTASSLSPVEKEYMATKEKERGNECYRSHDFEQAVKFYSNSIVLCPTPAAYNNRAMAQLKLQRYDAVIADCNQVLEAEPLNVKALHRRGVAHEGKSCYEQAYEDFSKVIELEPENQAAKLLTDKMKRKLEPAVKSVRLSIEDECFQPHGFVFPSPKPNIPVNEWGLAKTMCRCNGTPSWVHRKPPKCKICQRKRTERRAKREEEARKLAEGSEVYVGANDDENLESEKMQTDEKGSGDMKATEKIVCLETRDNMQTRQLDTCIRVEEQSRNLDTNVKEKGDSSLESTITKVDSSLEGTITKVDSSLESTVTNDEKENSYTSNTFTKEKIKNEIEEHKDITRSTINEMANCKAVSAEASKSQTELDHENVIKSPKEIKQKSLLGIDNASGKPVKIKIANKYKKNTNTELETPSEQQNCEDLPSLGTITSPFEFVKVWESLKVTSDLSSHAQVLRSVRPSDLSSVIGNKLDGPMLSTILMCLEKNFAPDLVLEYLNNIMKLPRFGIVKMFLQESEKQAVRRLLEKLESSNVHPSGALWKAFTC